MGMWTQFLTTNPHFRIGQRVRVVGKYAADWPMECIVTGIEFNAVRGSWNISIMPKEEIEDRLGATDGFTPEELVNAL